MDYGLLMMYVFLALIIAGSLIYSKWEDKHLQQEQ